MTGEIAASHRASTLVASYCFPPYGGPGAVAAAKRVRERGEPVDVIYNAMDATGSFDPALLGLCGDLVRRFAAVASPTHVSRWADITAFTRLGMDQALAWEQSRGPYSRLYSRADYPASHILGAWFAAARPETTWTAEFSGPLSLDIRGRDRHADVTENVVSANLRREVESRGFRLPGDNVFEWAEVLPFVLADELLFIDAGHRDLMLERCHDPDLAALAETKATVRPLPVPPGDDYHRADGRDELDDHRRHIGYFGPPDRSVDTVVEALGALPSSLRSGLVVHVFTAEVGRVRADPKVAALGDAVVVRPYPRYFEFLNACTHMDCLLVSDPGTGPVLAPEVSDYLGSGTPLWGVVGPGSRITSEVLTHRSPVDHVSAAVQVLGQIARA